MIFCFGLPEFVSDWPTWGPNFHKLMTSLKYQLFVVYLFAPTKLLKSTHSETKHTLLKPHRSHLDVVAFYVLNN